MDQLFGSLFGETACCSERAFMEATPRGQRPANMRAFTRDEFIEVEVSHNKSSLHDHDLYPNKNDGLSSRPSERDMYCLEDLLCAERVDDRASETRWREKDDRREIQSRRLAFAKGDSDLMPTTLFEAAVTVKPNSLSVASQADSQANEDGHKSIEEGSIPEGSALAARKDITQELPQPPGVQQQFHFTVQQRDKAQKTFDKVKKEFMKIQKETFAARSIQLDAPRKYGEKEKKSEDLQEIHTQRKKYEQVKAKFDEAAESLELAKFEHNRAKRILDMQAHAQPSDGSAAKPPLASITSRTEALRRAFSRSAMAPASSSGRTPSPQPRPVLPSHPAARTPSPMVAEAHTAPPKLAMQDREAFLNAEADKPVVLSYLHISDAAASPPPMEPPQPLRAGSMPPLPPDGSRTAGGSESRTRRGGGGEREGPRGAGRPPRQLSLPPWDRWSAAAKAGRDPLPQAAYPPLIRPTPRLAKPGSALEVVGPAAKMEAVGPRAGSAYPASSQFQMGGGVGIGSALGGHLAGGSEVVM